MRYIIIISVFFLSCGTDKNKQKELELKEKELNLKERELDLEEADTIRSSKIPSVTENKLPHEKAVIKSVKATVEGATYSSSFPIIELSDKIKEAEINSYLIAQVLGQDVNTTSLKKELQTRFDSGIPYHYEVKKNNPPQLLIRITEYLTGGPGTQTTIYDISIDLNSGSKKVKKSHGYISNQ